MCGMMNWHESLCARLEPQCGCPETVIDHIVAFVLPAAPANLMDAIGEYWSVRHGAVEDYFANKHTWCNQTNSIFCCANSIGKLVKLGEPPTPAIENPGHWKLRF